MQETIISQELATETRHSKNREILNMFLSGVRKKRKKFYRSQEITGYSKIYTMLSITQIKK